MNPELQARLEETSTKFGEYVREKRKVNNLTIRELAETLGISASYIRDIELGNRQAPKNQLPRMVEVLKIPEDEVSLFYDLAGASRGHQYEDLNSYLKDQDLARVALRLARDHGIDREAWQRIIDEILRS